MAGRGMMADTVVRWLCAWGSAREARKGERNGEELRSEGSPGPQSVLINPETSTLGRLRQANNFINLAFQKAWLIYYLRLQMSVTCDIRFMKLKNISLL